MTLVYPTVHAPPPTHTNVADSYKPRVGSSVQGRAATAADISLSPTRNTAETRTAGALFQ
jgi:hypothetical protein